MNKKFKSTILLVDDENTNIDFLNKKLSKLYNIKVANDGLTAIKILENFEIDLVILDIIMPKLDGYETMEKIKANPKIKHIPVIFLTMQNNSDSISKAFELGAKDYISKPFNIKELLARVDTQLKTFNLQRELETEKEKFQIILKNSGESIHILDMEENIILCSDSFCELLGYTEEEAKKLKFTDYDIKISNNEKLNITELRSKSFRYESVYKKKDGSTINVLVSTNPIKFHENYYIYCSSKDVTQYMIQSEQLSEHKAELLAQNEELITKEKQLLNASEELEILFEEAPISYFIIDKNLNIIKQNLTSLRKLKKPLNNIFGTILEKDSFYNTIVYLDQCEVLDSGINVRIKNKFNKIIHAKIFATKYSLDTTKYFVSVTDTENEFKLLKEKEKTYLLDKQLIEQSKLAQMGEMIGNIAHQWRQPLSVISVAATGSLFKSQINELDKNDLEESYRLINKEAQYLSETIDTFRNFLLESKNREEVIIQDRINKAISIIGINLKNNHIKIQTNCDEVKPIKYELVVGELTQVIINMINNSKDVLKDNNIKEKLISINLKEDKSFVYICIEDNGGGIEEKILNKIFEPYFTTKDKSIGTGLGLYMSYQIIQNSLNGNIDVENTIDGVKFTIIIPKA